MGYKDLNRPDVPSWIEVGSARYRNALQIASRLSQRLLGTVEKEYI
jgi:hypothetical protein